MAANAKSCVFLLHCSPLKSGRWKFPRGARWEKNISRESSFSLRISDPFYVFLIIFRNFQKLPPWKSIQEQSHRRKNVSAARLGGGESQKVNLI